MQHDYVIENNPGAAFRTDLNAVLQAIATLNAGSTPPAVTFPNMLWYDTANSILWKRTNADDDWAQVPFGKASSSDGDTGTDDSKYTTVARVLAMIKKHKTRVGTVAIAAGELDIDASLYDVVNVAADDDFTLNMPANGEAGDRITLRITQNEVGSKALTIGAGINISSELAEDGIVLSTAAGAVDKIGLYCVSPSLWEIDSFGTDYAEPA